MTNSINCVKPQYPSNYSGVTINITNPAVNTIPSNCIPQCNYCYPTIQQNNQNPLFQTQAAVQNLPTQTTQISNSVNQADYSSQSIKIQKDTLSNTENQKTNPAGQDSNYNDISNQSSSSITYPASYYMNNYNNNQSRENYLEKEKIATEKEVIEKNSSQQDTKISTAQQNNPEALVVNIPEETNPNSTKEFETSPLYYNPQKPISQVNENNLDTSKNIIENLDKITSEQKELEKNGTKKKIVALTNEYIMTLENYLNNPNIEMRLMAAKEILTRLDEDHSRFDDAALNALLNKMLQDPEKIVRIAAFSALSSGLASGNDYTVQLLHNIQNNPNADKIDAVEAANILLQMTTNTETRYEEIPHNTQA